MEHATRGAVGLTEMISRVPDEVIGTIDLKNSSILSSMPPDRIVNGEVATTPGRWMVNPQPENLHGLGPRR